MAAINAMVNVKNNNVDFALKLLKKKLKDTGTFLKFEEHLGYEKPSEKKKRKRAQAIRKQKYEQSLKTN